MKAYMVLDTSVKHFGGSKYFSEIHRQASRKIHRQRASANAHFPWIRLAISPTELVPML
jgi:hypothetical protein